VRVLLLSDIHSNLEALEACLKAAPNYDSIANLGDVVGYGANPNEVIEHVQAMQGLLVRGNHDRACSGISNMSDFNPTAAMAVMWTRTMLTRKNNGWLRELPTGPMQSQAVRGASFVHGSVLDEDEYLLETAGAIESLREAATEVTFFGHTHIQGGFALEGKSAVALRPAYKGGDVAEQFEMQLLPEARYLINPGSVGQPRDNDWRAAFAVFDAAVRIVTYFRVPYAVETAQRRIREAGLPERLAARLAQGC